MLTLHAFLVTTFLWNVCLLSEALLEARAVNKEQLPKVTAQLVAQTEQACSAASITSELSTELEKAEKLIVTCRSRLANEQACPQRLAMALLEARATNEVGFLLFVALVASAIRQSPFAAMQGLDVIHGCGLVHGDIKPNNFRVAMQPDGSQVHLVITDLGTCCAAGSEDESGVKLTYDELLQLALLRQAQWGTESSQGSPLPYGLDALKESVPDDEDCQQAVDLLQRMLKMEPSHRPSAQEALSHPFTKL
ncbi:hypothetical protein WJX77_006443 [Trebouxia sp. C0004]